MSVTFCLNSVYIITEHASIDIYISVDASICSLRGLFLKKLIDFLLKSSKSFIFGLICCC